MRYARVAFQSLFAGSALVCASQSLAGTAWQVSGSASTEVVGTSLVIRAIVSVTDETGAPVNGLTRSNFSVGYSLRSALSNSLNEGSIQGPANGALENDGKGTYVLAIETAGIAQPPSVVRSIVIRVIQRQIIPVGPGPGNAKIVFNQRAAVVVPVVQ